MFLGNFIVKLLTLDLEGVQSNAFLCLIIALRDPMILDVISSPSSSPMVFLAQVSTSSLPYPTNFFSPLC